MLGLPLTFTVPLVLVALADIEPVVTGGTAPVDALGGFAGDERPELPERLAHPGATAAMDAMGQARSDAPRFEKKTGHPLRQRQGGFGLGASRRAGLRFQHPDTGHVQIPTGPAAPSGGR